MSLSLTFHKLLNFFASRSLLIDQILPAHDTATTPDVLTTLTVNKDYRSLIVAALDFYLEANTDTYIDNEDKVLAMVLDLYDIAP